MLCAVCLSMFHNELRHGYHHASLEDMEKAALNGCKICITLMLRREHFGPDNEQEEAASPFLTYFWRYEKANGWRIQFRSDVAWLDFWKHLPWNEIKFHISDTPEKPEWWYVDLVEHALDDLKNKPWLVRREAFPSRLIPDNTGHPDVMKLARLWLKNCESFHNCETLNGTEDRAWCPKRLIVVSDLKTQPRLLERDLERPNGRYATLSHCWGPDPNFLTLRADNLEKFRQSIPSNIPKSFCDAISICRYLGIHYLWIDSLCILQAGEGSEEDWLLHTDEMASVYLNSLLNLSFDAGNSPEDGAFIDRNPDFLQPCHIFSSILDKDLKWRNGRTSEVDPNDASTAEKSSSIDSETYDWGFLSDNVSGRDVDATAICGPLETLSARKFTVLSAQDLQYRLESLPLHQRGWAFQERLLSPRILHFMSDRIAYECGSDTFYSEYLPAGLDTGIAAYDWMGYSFNLPIKDVAEEKDLSSNRDEWYKCVRFYTSRRLSYPENDKLVAIAAVAQKFVTFLGGDYFAGHFLSEMPKDLVWEAAPIGGRDVAKQPRVTDKPWRAPTWSWASVDGRVIPLHYWHREAKPVDLAELLEIHVELVNPEFRFGPVKSGYVRVGGLLIQCLLLEVVARDSRKCVFQLRQDDKESDKLELELCVTFDQAVEEGLWDHIYAIPIVQFQYTSSECCNVAGGIFVVKDPQDPMNHRRVGAFHTGIGDSWSIHDDRSITSHHRIIGYCDRYAGWKQDIKIV